MALLWNKVCFTHDCQQFATARKRKKLQVYIKADECKINKTRLLSNSRSGLITIRLAFAPTLVTHTPFWRQCTGSPTGS